MNTMIMFLGFNLKKKKSHKLLKLSAVSESVVKISSLKKKEYVV